MTRFLFVFLIACTTAPAPGPMAPQAPAYAGPRTVKKGDRTDGNLRLGETHVFRIELAADEHVKVAISGESGPNGPSSGCGNWGWGWKSPDGVELTSNPLDLAPNPDGSGRRGSGAPLDLAARVPESGDFVGKAGVWTFELRADPVNCQAIRYQLAFE